MVKPNYISAETFEGFKQNQDLMINILNHNMTEMKDDFKTFCKDITKSVNSMGKDIASMKTNTAGLSGTVKWIMGIFSAILISGILGVIFG